MTYSNNYTLLYYVRNIAHDAKGFSFDKLNLGIIPFMIATQIVKYLISQKRHHTRFQLR